MNIIEGQVINLNVELTPIVVEPPEGYHIIILPCDQDGWSQVTYDGNTISTANVNILGLEQIYNSDDYSIYYNPDWPESQNTLKELTYNGRYFIKAPAQEWVVPDYTGNGVGGYHYISLAASWNYDVIWDGPDYMPTDLAVATLSSFSQLKYYKKYYPCDTAKDRVDLLRYGERYTILVYQSEEWKIPDPNDDYVPLWNMPSEPALVSPQTYLSMTEEELFAHLIWLHVANDWWNMSYTDRHTLGLKIIQWFSATIQAHSLAYGGSWCTAAPSGGLTNVCPGPDCIGGLGAEFLSAQRYTLFTNYEVYPNNVYYYKKTDQKWYCGYAPYDFGLPTSVALETEWLNCLQIASDTNNLDSWIFFQDDRIDLHPGSDSWYWPKEHGTLRMYSGDIRCLEDGRTDLNYAQEEDITY